MKRPGVQKQLRRVLKDAAHAFEGAFLAVPEIALKLIVAPGKLIWTAITASIGLAWLWIGDFIIAHTPTVRLILAILEDWIEVAGIMFNLTAMAVEAAIDVVASIANAAGGVINKIGSIFGDDHIVPKIPMIPVAPFPLINFDNFIADLDQLGNATATCAPFDAVLYEMAFPIRTALNKHICPVVRYMTNTIVEGPFAWLLSPFYFDSTPLPGNNCNESSAWSTCFWLRFGSLLLYIIAPIQLFYFFFPAIKKLLIALIELFIAATAVVFDLLLDILHGAFHKTKAHKKK